MKSFYTLYNTDFPNLTDDSATANKTLGKSLINSSQQVVLGYAAWPFLEMTGTRNTVDGTAAYQLPARMRKITAVKVVVGTTTYRPKPVEDPNFWHYLQGLSTGESDAAQYFYPEGSQMSLYPTPASDDSVITMRGRKGWKDLSLADYTTGTIVTATLADETIVGGSTVWTGQKPVDNQWIRIDPTTGDNQWYEIDSVTDNTNLELVKPYEGVSIATGTETYTIGEMSIIPGIYHDLLLWRSLAIAFSRYSMKTSDDSVRANRFWRLYDGGYEASLDGPATKIGGLMGVMIHDQLEKTEGVFLEPAEYSEEDLKRFRIDTITGESW